MNVRRVLVLGDSHFDEHSRFEECRSVHAWIADKARELDVHAIVHTGDVMERKSTPLERAAVADFLQVCASQAPVLIVRGNHDFIGDLTIFERLQTRYRITVEEGAGVHLVSGLRIGALAWPRRASLEAMWRETHGRAPSPDESATAAREALRMVVAGMASEGPHLVAAHAMVRGSTTSTGQPLVGCDMEIGVEDLRLSNAPVVLGHIHAAQQWEAFGHTEVIYTGSPRRTAFGEVEAKSVLLLTFENGVLVEWDRIQTPCRRMELVEAEASLMGLKWDDPPGFRVPDSEIRLRYSVEPDHREVARRAAETTRDMWLANGAHAVKLEERVIAASSARAPEVAQASTLAAKLRAMWAAREEQLDDARQDRLLSMVSETEEAA